jgi:hypothetical protein
MAAAEVTERQAHRRRDSTTRGTWTSDFEALHRVRGKDCPVEPDPARAGILGSVSSIGHSVICVFLAEELQRAAVGNGKHFIAKVAHRIVLIVVFAVVKGQRIVLVEIILVRDGAG